MTYRVLRFVAVLALGLVVPASAGASTISAGGGSFVQSWGKDAGNPNTQTYGQTITAPADSVLTDFSFWLGRTSTNFPVPTDPSLDFMAYVYSWNEGLSMAEGPALFTSGVFTHNASTSTPFTQYTFVTGGLALTPGNTYALFLSTSGLAGLGHVQWEAATLDEYAGGHFIFLNNGEDTGQWTTAVWGSGIASDLHFEANFSDRSVPEPTTLLLLGTGFGVAFVRRKIQARG